MCRQGRAFCLHPTLHKRSSFFRICVCRLRRSGMSRPSPDEGKRSAMSAADLGAAFRRTDRGPDPADPRPDSGVARLSPRRRVVLISGLSADAQAQRGATFRSQTTHRRGSRGTRLSVTHERSELLPSLAGATGASTEWDSPSTATPGPQAASARWSGGRHAWRCARTGTDSDSPSRQGPWP